MPPKIVFNHPSVKRLQITGPNITFSSSGLLQSDKRISFFIKNKSAQHGSVASKDLSINGHYYLKSSYNINNNFIPNNNFPNLQQFGGMCQTIPFLHMIQSQIYFPIDYNALWSCIEADFNINGSILTNITNFLGDEGGINYTKLYNLLFSGKCFPIKEDICRDNTLQPIGLYSEKNCDNKCHLRIKIHTIKESPIYTEEDLCERINSLGPRLVGCYGLTTIRLQVLNKNPNLTWDIVKNMSLEELNNYLPQPYSSTRFLGHALTIIGCSDNKFQLINSWGSNNFLSVTYEELLSNFELHKSIVGNALQVITGLTDLYDYYPVVEPCLPLPDRDLTECRDNLCKDKGYDGGLKMDWLDNDSEECDCYCDKVIAPETENVSVITVVPCVNAGDEIDKIYAPSDSILIKAKCVCPPHPIPEFYYYAGENCCETYTLGSWCEQLYCEQTDVYYQTGITAVGSSLEFIELNINQLAVNWERKSIEQRDSPCVDQWSMHCNATTPTP